MLEAFNTEEATAAELLLENKKAQERVAIQALISINQLSLQTRSSQLQASLTSHAEDMKGFVSSTLTSDLEGCFKGKAADAAKEHLQAIPQPNLSSPIK